MGPMLPEQQEQPETITKTSSKQQLKQLQSPWNIDNLQCEHQDDDLDRNRAENVQRSSRNDGNFIEMQREEEQVCRLLTSRHDHVEFSTRHYPLKMMLVLRSTDAEQRPMDQQQQDEEGGRENRQGNVMHEESSVDFTLESPLDVKSNYTRRRRRGRLRSPSTANHQTETDIRENVKKKPIVDARITTNVDDNKMMMKYDSELQHKEYMVNKKNNNNINTALTINLDNNTRKLIQLRNKTTQPQPDDAEELAETDAAANANEDVKRQMNKLILEKFTMLPLLLLLLVITSLSKFYRYVHININKNIIININNRKPRRRLAAANITNPSTTTSATTTTTTTNIKLKFKLKLNNNNKIVKNYTFLIGLCVATTILPLNLVNAASPFQNTQKHTNHNNNNNHGGGGGSSASSSVLTPSPSFPVSSAASSSETEFLYPLSQSEETFDDDDNSLQYSIPQNETDHDNFTIAKTPLFPEDLFTKEQLENGAVICHIIGVIYMFVALAIVCDEFFVPSLDVIIEKLGITDDVAGATFMAAGGSAPELFTSVIGVFVSFDDVGIGTIVGSAVFNILFVIGMCALFSKTVLSLTWWPLFRDCSFYSVSLLILIYFFRDNLIYWWEALVLFSVYLAYVGFMKWNQQVERCVKKVITKNKVTRVRSTDQLMPAGNAANSSETSMATQPGGSVTSRAASETRSGPAGSSSGATGNSSGGTAGSTQTGAKFRHGLLQLMIHTIDPLHDDDVPGKVDEKATQLHAIASLKVLLDATKPQRGGATTSAANHVKINLKETTLADRPNGNIDTTLDSPSLNARRPSWIEQRVKIQTRRFSTKGNEVEDPPDPLSMAWPSTARKRLTYVLVAPLLVPMWLTLPDTRTPRGKRFFPVTFIGSIVWIAAYSYLMVWWANVAGDTARIPPEVMGLTFLAAGTSIPDLITSVIVARKGFGDMAVSSSVGSNIFDVTVGLPIPWLLYGIIYDQPVEVNSVGMVCSITILFMMLLFVVMSIACFRWKMNKGLGFTMFLLYFVFVAVSLMFEYNIITCPV